MTSLFATHPLPAHALDLARIEGIEVVVRAESSPIDPRELQERAAAADGLISTLNDSVDAELLSSTSLKVVSNCAVGYDNIDVNHASKLHIAVTNTPGVLTEATADLTLALILATARRIPEGDAFLRAGKYTNWVLEQEQMGLDLAGRTIGIIGLGKIGQAVAHRAVNGFGMRCVYAQPTAATKAVEQSLDARHVGLDLLLEEADVVSIHAPLNDATHHLIAREQLRRMKPTAILVNTARGPIVNERDLADALNARTVWGAGLDVYEHEPRVISALLERQECLVLLPHLGSATFDTRRRMAELAVQNAVDVLMGRRPDHVINPKVLEVLFQQ